MRSLCACAQGASRASTVRLVLINTSALNQMQLRARLHASQTTFVYKLPDLLVGYAELVRSVLDQHVALKSHL